ncbi:MAG TPA: DUF1800 domain-containing protein [Polyangia bacterium]
MLSATPALAEGGPPQVARAPERLSREDLAWLRRASFGLDSAEVARFHKLGRARYLQSQLAAGEDELPPAIESLLRGYEALRIPAEQLAAAQHAEQQRIKSMPDGSLKVAAKKSLQQHGSALLQQAEEAELLHAVYGTDQLKEELVWFWLNHFSVYGAKGRVRWVAADYAENTIRPHALGKFRDLVMATLQSPAMLEYLDNAQNAKGKINENYARELMELHTLGVGSGYTQEDVQQLARILTGVGVAPPDGRPRHLPPKWQALYIRRGLFEFNPARHDFASKMFLGHAIEGSGFEEVEKALALITRQPACARFISLELAKYFIADDPPPALVAKMARTFRRTDGDIAQVMRTLFESKRTGAPAQKFADPTQFVVSAVRLAYDGKAIADAAPLRNWLHQLGEPTFGRLTPDGWPLDAAGWSSSGQLAERFRIARAVGTGNNRLFTAEGSTEREAGFPMLTTRLYYQAFDPYLAPATRNALSKAQSQQEWNTFLLSSPDFNER